MGEEGRRLRSTNRYLQNSHGDVKYSRGNGEAKGLIRMTCGHELSWGECWRVGGQGGEEIKGEKLGKL